MFCCVKLFIVEDVFFKKARHKILQGNFRKGEFTCVRSVFKGKAGSLRFSGFPVSCPYLLNKNDKNVHTGKSVITKLANFLFPLCYFSI